MKTLWLLWGNGQVNPAMDVTDWYQGEFQLDDKGVPSASYCCGPGECKWMPLTAIPEDCVVRDVPPLKSEGRTDKWTRWVRFDGRMIRELEGQSAARSGKRTLTHGPASGQKTPAKKEVANSMSGRSPPPVT